MIDYTGKPFVVTEETRKAPWRGRFRCSWCGYDFKTGDTCRFIMTNTDEPATKGISGNPFVCAKCDGPREEILAKLRAMKEEFMAERFWWFRANVRQEGEGDGAREEAREQARLHREEAEDRRYREELRETRGY